MSLLITGTHSSASGEIPPVLEDGCDLYLVRPGDQPWHDGKAVAHYEVRFWSNNPLVLRTGKQMKDWWEKAGGCAQVDEHVVAGDWERFHPGATRRFTAVVRAAGYDAIVIAAAAVAQEGSPGERDRDAYDWGASTFGEPQSIILEASRAQIRRIDKEA